MVLQVEQERGCVVFHQPQHTSSSKVGPALPRRPEFTKTSATMNPGFDTALIEFDRAACFCQTTIRQTKFLTH
jgi:hypothetical protein